MNECIINIKKYKIMQEKYTISKSAKTQAGDIKLTFQLVNDEKIIIFF